MGAGGAGWFCHGSWVGMQGEFELANKALTTHGATIYLKQGQFLGYSTLAIGSAVALMLYPHTATAVLSAKNANTVRRNAAMLPAYSFLLGADCATGVCGAGGGGVVTKGHELGGAIAVFEDVFRSGFAGFCLAAVAVERWCRRRLCRLRLRICLHGIFGASF